ncbi:hypothetical protein [Enterocloster clostridioformis]|jgi:hypothetical protein|uniref:Uncharacterized protein n=1 Tax=Enterocloster clostridioformis TaxID=1531 RepID=A0A829VUP9_9FIRM|nr:hypothetical protein [Enterocloster clostridioformis]ENZ28728.1 hypothetical protein HMPREF1087_01222 [[Clostridium] clostridioforme 90A1]ENZ72449.1 hypothetical protein HMPREF1081_00866 [[Clostridium] clostridioforme 90A4]GEA37602.1 hypothetical protein Ccl03g_33150 [Enterocloster clostridioformis]
MTLYLERLPNSRKYNGGIVIDKVRREYFTRFPNEYIQENIKTKFGVSRKFYITYILIDKYRSYEDYSWITVRKILEFYGYKTTSRKPKAFKEVLDVLEYMINNKMIKIQCDLDSLNYDTGIEIKIIPENFDYPDHFCKLTSSQLDVIMMNDSVINRECLLMAFLYINSYIGNRPKKDDGSEVMFNPETKPEAFWRSIESMSKELSMSKDTITQCIDFLTTSTGDKKALLIKREVGSVQPDPRKPPQNVPNIYVLNKDGYQQEIEWALHKMLEVYGVDSFDKIKGGIKNKPRNI